jgi:uncharacterized protein YdiU (UPF0061 family)
LDYRPSPALPALGEGHFDEVVAATFPRHALRFRNDRWAERVGLTGLDDAAWVEHFGRFTPLAGNLPRPLALRYHGYQFRSYNARLGDGRGFVFAQLRDDQGRLLDLGTKGSGQTPWSRAGDGRLTLKGGVREVLATEMLEALGVNTSRSFSLIETGEKLSRGDEPSPTRSSVLVRLSHSHLRFGAIERLHHLGEREKLSRFVRYLVDHYYPHLAAIEGESARVAALYREVARRLADLCGAWLAAGFVHGVLNTDNMSLTGESFDYGPYRFLPAYDPAFVAAYFDETGLYAFGRQPEAIRWNLERLADALATLCPPRTLGAALVDLEARVMASFHGRFLRRLGLAPLDAVSDALLVERALCFLREAKIPFDRFFFDWYGGLASERRALGGPHGDLHASPRFSAVRRELALHEPLDLSRLSHPYFQRTEPVSLVFDVIERTWDAIAQRDDWAPFHQLIADIRELGDAIQME